MAFNRHRKDDDLPDRAVVLTRRERVAVFIILLLVAFAVGCLLGQR